MRKMCLFAAIAVGVLLVGCGSNNGAQSNYKSNTKSVDDVLSEQSGESTKAVVVTPPSLEVVEAAPVVVDIDLTKENATMVYSIVSDMLNTPGDYLGQTVRIKGTHNAYEENGKIYNFCLVQDATACCSQGFEFTTENGKYPPYDQDIVVVGRFETYDEDGVMYLRLADCIVE